jgi:hypothetical protein
VVVAHELYQVLVIRHALADEGGAFGVEPEHGATLVQCPVVDPQVRHHGANEAADEAVRLGSKPSVMMVVAGLPSGIRLSPSATVQRPPIERTRSTPAIFMGGCPGAMLASPS